MSVVRCVIGAAVVLVDGALLQVTRRRVVVVHGDDVMLVEIYGVDIKGIVEIDNVVALITGDRIHRLRWKFIIEPHIW